MGNGAEGEGRLAAAGDAREHDQRAAGVEDVHVLEIVDAGAADMDEAVSVRRASYEEVFLAARLRNVIE
jgi:hypothetical protein